VEFRRPARSRRPWRTVVVAALAAALLAACGGGGGGGAAAAGPPDPAASLRAGWTVGPTHLDPHMAQSEVAWFRFGFTSVYDRLFTVTAAGEAKGMLVEDFDYAPDGLGLNLTLRQGVTFRDGKALDAAAVKVNLDRARTLQSPAVKSRMTPVTDVTVTGPYTLTLTLDRPTPAIPYVLADMAGFIMHPDLIANGDPATTVNGSGAYSVESFTPGQSLVLVRDRDDYWDSDAAKVAKIEHRVIGDFQAFSNALAGGQIDIGQFQPNNVASIEGRPGLATVPVPQGISSDFMFNRDIAPMNDVNVRKAINLALDREAITQALYPGSQAKYQYYREGLPGYDPTIKPTPRDVEGAKALLAQSGLTGGVDLGEILVSTAVTKGLIEVVQQQLLEAGIRMTPVSVDAIQIFSRYAEGKSAGLVQFSQTGTEPSAGASAVWGRQLNPAGTTPEFDALLAAAADNRKTPEERSVGYQAFQHYLLDEAWSAPITFITYPWVMSERLGGFSAQMDYATTIGPYDFRYLTMAAASS
jgi:peptide/nickel transport system substrate-binding protein